MRELNQMGTIQIDVTNICTKSCSNCTRFCGHYTSDKLYYMDPSYYEEAVCTLKNHTSCIGMIGGEPTIHPEFLGLCQILNSHVSDKQRKGLWSNLHTTFYKHQTTIANTFGIFNLNDHKTNEILHTPILIASDDLIKSKLITEEEFERFTDNCWVQLNWSATINPRGAYFCEVAGMLSYLFDGPEGLDIEKHPNWINYPLSAFKYQRDWACRRCGCQIPLPPRRSNSEVDDMTVTNYNNLVSINSPKIKSKKYSLFEGQLDRTQVRDNTWYWNR